MAQEKYVAYVGTYTHENSVGIHIYDVDVTKGYMKERKVVPINNPSDLVVSKNRKFLYSIADEGVEAFKILKDGDLEPINEQWIGGMRGCYVEVDDENRYLFVGGHHDGRVTMMRLNEDGSIGDIADGIFHIGMARGSDRRTNTPHVDCVKLTPDQKFLCAVDNGLDQVKIYRINKKKDKLELVDILRCPRESGPRIIRFSDDGKFAYILFELTNEIKTYKYDGSGKVPAFELIQTIETSAKKDVHDTHNAASGLSLANDGKHLFCTTAGEDTVSMFERDEETGMLTRKFTLPISGEYPKDLVLLPDDKHLVLANHASNTLTTFTVDYEKNIIVMNGKPIKITEPNCIRIWPVPEE